MLFGLPQDLYLDAQVAYFDSPYHNLPHGIDIRQAVMLLTNNDEKWPLSFGALLHDACHTWEARAPWDEKIAVKIATIIWRKYGLSDEFISKSNSWIMGTVFSQRANLILPDQKLMADADLSALWSPYQKYVKNAVLLLLEEKKNWVTDEEIVQFFSQGQESFFKHLTEISRRPETPYLTPEWRTAFPHFSSNRDTIARQVEENPSSLIDLVRNHEQRPEIQAYRNT